MEKKLIESFQFEVSEGRLRFVCSDNGIREIERHYKEKKIIIL